MSNELMDEITKRLEARGDFFGTIGSDDRLLKLHLLEVTLSVTMEYFAEKAGKFPEAELGKYLHEIIYKIPYEHTPSHINNSVEEGRGVQPYFTWSSLLLAKRVYDREQMRVGAAIVEGRRLGKEMVSSRNIYLEARIDAALEYVDGKLDFMWAAVIAGFLLGCDFRDAKDKLKQYKLARSIHNG